ncbi:N-acetylmuramoyl-L-alanine amidase [Sneathiella marina]|uniref:N-acetylmuramoyl-L-alanine amidase n=1 Tax=Sneathiella marina TaxID=2950108 RepID=A0ABY4W2S5_9PROT|nr:N-acetylmuramoyl-L-alanine amidase [Sneathiella marina]USG60413.1 N-acetylmuramoyl-L-alanine amidase [Sneathiella marina]
MVEKTIWQPSPNFDDRGDGVPTDMLVLHYTGMETGAAALARLTEENSQVSAHYLVEEDGTVFQLVEEKNRAWHAGVSAWRGETNINARSIGIEIVNPGHEFGYRAFPDNQMASVADLSKDIVERHGIQPTHVVGHSDVAPARKEDPGELFAWEKLSEIGVGIWFGKGWRADLTRPSLHVGSEGDIVQRLREHLRGIGYGVAEIGLFDDELSVVIKAFQRHWRPNLIDGVADSETQSAVEEIFKRSGRLTPLAARLT